MENPTYRPRSSPRYFAGILAVAMTLFAPMAVLAHSNEYLATIKGAHGGMLRMVEEKYQFELVINRGEAHVWVTDHGDLPKSTKGASGTLRLLSKGGAFTLGLQPAGNNELVATDPRIATLPGLRGILSVTLKDEKPLQARYTVDAQSDAPRKQ